MENSNEGLKNEGVVNLNWTTNQLINYFVPVYVDINYFIVKNYFQIKTKIPNLTW